MRLCSPWLNPDPEIDPDLVMGHAAVIATGRSDYANQINNVRVFSGILSRDAGSPRLRRVTDEMKIAAANAIADVIAEKDLMPDYIFRSVLDKRVAAAVGKAVAKTAIDCGVAKREHKPAYRISP